MHSPLICKARRPGLILQSTAVVAFILSPKNSGLSKMRERAFGLLKNTEKARIIELRGEDIPFMVEEYSAKGILAIGLTGEDLLEEYCLGQKSESLQILKRIEWKDPSALFGRPTLCLLGPRGKTLEQLPKSLTVCICAKYKNTAGKFLEKLEAQGFSFRKIYAAGCVETGYAGGISDIVIDIVYSGSTMEKSGLAVYEKIRGSDFAVICGKTPEPVKIFLDKNESFSGCAPRVLQSMRMLSQADMCRYPEYGKLEKKLADYLGINSEEVCITNGGAEAIKAVFTAFVQKGDEVIMQEPSYFRFELEAKIRQASITKVPFENDFSFRADNLISQISEKTRLVVIANPNNPTGTVISEEGLIGIIEKVKGGKVLLDEAYAEFYGKTFAGKIAEYENLIILRSFSKAFGLAGIRIGYAVSCRKNTDAIRQVLQTFNVSNLALIAAEKALEDIPFMENCARSVKSNGQYLRAKLEQAGAQVVPSEANFVLVRLGAGKRKVLRALCMAGIAVKEFGNSGALAKCIRITIGNREECELIGEIIARSLKSRALIFDMDGVLVDTSSSYQAAAKMTAEFFLGKKVSPIELQKIKKSGTNNEWECVQKLLQKYGVQTEMGKIVEKFGQLMENGFFGKEKLLITSETLEKLSRRANLAIVTGRPRKEAMDTLAKFGISRFFDKIITMDDLPKNAQKPSPLGLQMAISEMGTDQNTYIGDMPADAAMARAANVEFIGVLSPGYAAGFAQSLKGAKSVLANINDIMEAIT